MHAVLVLRGAHKTIRISSGYSTLHVFIHALNILLLLNKRVSSDTQLKTQKSSQSVNFQNFTNDLFTYVLCDG